MFIFIVTWQTHLFPNGQPFTTNYHFTEWSWLSPYKVAQAGLATALLCVHNRKYTHLEQEKQEEKRITPYLSLSSITMHLLFSSTFSWT